MSLFRFRVLRPLGVLGTAAFAAQTLAACYTQQPLADPAAAAARQPEVVVELTDRGRYELRGVIGESPRTVQGRLVAADESTYTLAASSVTSITGEVVPWTRERVRLPRSGVGLVQSRALSRRRTVFAFVVVGVAAVAALVGVGLNTFGRGGDDNRSERPGGGQES